MRTRVRYRALFVVCVASLALGTAVAQQNLHGAASSDAQQQALDKLRLSRDGSSVPSALDAQAWHASVPQDNALDAKRIALGRRVYFETALSKDGTVSCATCHDVTRSFTDRRPVSEGVGGALGRRNSPTTMNAALLHTQFWDGRAGSLEHQAGQPILNPVEMALTSEAEAVQKLNDAGYGPAFQEAYGRALNYKDIERALGAFERTLLFLDAPFDRFIAGQRDALTDEARAGFELFNGKARCVTCHAINRNNPLGTDNRFHNIGVSARTKDFEKLAREALAILKNNSSEQKLDELALATDFSELGRFMVTKSFADIGAFRTSQLRNIGITAPYMHDGSMQSLWDVMDHYNRGGEPNAYLDGGMEALALSDQELDQLVAFMFTLTDDRFRDLNEAEHARQRGLSQKQRPFREERIAQRKELDFEARALGDKKLGGAQ